MEKSIKETHLRMTLDAKCLPKGGMDIFLSADKQDLKELAARFDIPKVISLTADILIEETNPIRLKGHLVSEFERVCVITLEPFIQKMDVDFQTFFIFGKNTKVMPDIQIDMEEDDVEVSENGKIDLKALIFEYFGLNLDPFPKKVDSFYEYADPMTQEEKEAENPFSVLKKLTKR